MFKVLISAPYMLRASEIAKVKPILDKLPIEYTLASVRERLDEHDLLPIIGNYDAVICGDDRFSAAVYQQAKKLKVVIKWGTGIDSLKKEIAETYGIAIRNTSNAFTDPVADTSVGMMLNFARNLVLNDSIIKEGGWDKPQGHAMNELTVGLIGLGNIGRAVAKRLNAFGTNILAYDIAEIPQNIYSEASCRKASLNEIFEKSHIISLHTDLNEKSFHILNANSFAQMKKRPFIINTARGPLIAENDLINAIERKQISGVGLDVFEDEPLPLTSPLRKFPNALLSSHNSNSSPTCWEKVHKNCIDILCQELKL